MGDSIRLLFRQKQDGNTINQRDGIGMDDLGEGKEKPMMRSNNGKEGAEIALETWAFKEIGLMGGKKF